MIDAGDALLGIDEQPFPVERDDLNAERVCRRRRSACADRGRARRPRRRRQPGAPSSPGSTRRATRGGRNRRNPADSGRARLEARNQKATPSVARIVGITIASMMPSELNRICRSATAIGPFGSRTPSVQPPERRRRSTGEKGKNTACQAQPALTRNGPMRRLKLARRATIPRDRRESARIVNRIRPAFVR